MLADQARRIIGAFADYPLPVRQEIGRTLRAQTTGTRLDFIGLLGVYLSDGFRSNPDSLYQVSMVSRALALAIKYPDDAIDRLGDVRPWRTVKEALEAAALLPDECAEALKQPPDPRLLYG